MKLTKIRNDITEKIDEMLGSHISVKSYICDEVFKGAMGIRVPGFTIGEVKVNENLEVIGFNFYEDSVKYFKNKNFEELTKFFGYRIER